MSAVSGEPARTGIASVAPQTSAAIARPEARATSPARKIQGIQAAAARWFHRSTSDRNGPDAAHTAADRAAPPRERPRRSPSTYMPAAEKRKWATTKHV